MPSMPGSTLRSGTATPLGKSHFHESWYHCHKIHKESWTWTPGARGMCTCKPTPLRCQGFSSHTSSCLGGLVTTLLQDLYIPPLSSSPCKSTARHMLQFCSSPQHMLQHRVESLYNQSHGNYISTLNNAWPGQLYSFLIFTLHISLMPLFKQIQL